MALKLKAAPKVRDYRAADQREAEKEAQRQAAIAARRQRRAEKRQQQNGELVEWAGVDNLTPPELIGALLDVARKMESAPQREAWRHTGQEFLDRQSENRRKRSEVAAGDQAGDAAA